GGVLRLVGLDERRDLLVAVARRRVGRRLGAGPLHIAGEVHHRAGQGPDGAPIAALEGRTRLDQVAGLAVGAVTPLYRFQPGGAADGLILLEQTLPLPGVTEPERRRPWEDGLLLGAGRRGGEAAARDAVGAAIEVGRRRNHAAPARGACVLVVPPERVVVAEGAGEVPDGAGGGRVVPGQHSPALADARLRRLHVRLGDGDDAHGYTSTR